MPQALRFYCIDPKDVLKKMVKESQVGFKQYQGIKYHVTELKPILETILEP